MSKDGVSRKDFLKGAATGAVGIAAMQILGGCATGPRGITNSADSIRGQGEKAAGGWRTPDAPITKVSRTVDTDVLVVGAGNGGLFAAAAAAEKGAKVIVLERNGMIGTGREWIGAIGSRAQKAAGIDIDKNEIVNEICRYASHRVDQRLINLWAEKSGETVDWLESVAKDYGVKVLVETDAGKETGGPYHPYKIQHNLQNDQKAVESTQLLKDKLGKMGVSILLETPMVQLIRSDKGERRVSGAIAKSKEGYIRFNARKGVILATGGYSNNLDMLGCENPIAVRSCATTASHSGSRGDGIKAATWIGAAKDEVPTVMIFDRGGLPVGEKTGDFSKGNFLHMGSQPFLKVNTKGERFCNESVPYNDIIHAASLEPGDNYCMIWDAAWREQTRQFHTIGCSRLQPSPSGSKLLLFSEEATAGFHEKVLMPAHIVVQADTIEELADKLQVPRDTLAATVKRYNELCAKGNDDDFGKEAYRMLPLLKPPFRGAHLAGQLLCTLDGLRINTRLQVLDTENQVIPGLYAAGNDSGGFFADNYPEYLPGLACGRTITFGRLAGQYAAD